VSDDKITQKNELPNTLLETAYYKNNLYYIETEEKEEYMKGKKKEKLYFCDWWEKLINKDSLFITYIIIIIIFTALGVSYFAITHYLDRQEEYKDLLDDYSDTLYDELEADVVNHINTRKTIDEVALHEIADTHSSSYDGEVTILNCSKKNSSGF